MLSRRALMKWMAASAAMAALPGCAPPEDAIPYVELPEGALPGVPRHYATAWSFAGWAQPVLATCHEGRPTKLEGNPAHPASRGRTDAFTQIAIMGLYDPDRAAALTRRGAISTWDALLAELVRRQQGWRQGKGLAVLTGATTSPTLMRQMDDLAGRYPGFRWHVFEPVDEANRAAGLAQAFGRPVEPVPHLDRARVWLSLDDDALGPGPWQTFHAGRWADARHRFHLGGVHPLVMAAEAIPSLTGAQAEDLLRVPPPRLPLLLAALAGQAAELNGAEQVWLARAHAALVAEADAALVTVGRNLAPEIHWLAASLNHRLRGALEYREPLMPQRPGLAELIEAIADGVVDTLLVLDCNPVHGAPAELRVAEAFAQVPLTLAATTHADETAAACLWHLPLAHGFEEWSDGRAVDGTAVIMQPLVRPLFGGIGRHRILAALAGRLDASPLALVRDGWGQLDDEGWMKALATGLVAGSAPPPLRLDAPAPPPRLMAPWAEFSAVIRPDAKVWDGRFANLAWAQEMGDPLTKVTWEHTATLAPATARRLGVTDGDLVRVRVEDGVVEAPACLLPGQAEDCVGLTLGGGRTKAGRIGSGIGDDLAPIRAAAAPWGGPCRIDKAGGARPLARLQTTLTMAGHSVLKLVEKPDSSPDAAAAFGPSLYPPWPWPGHAWAMGIDLDLCIGCNACLVACQAENTIPAVGRDQVALGRAMHWIRIDRYHDGGGAHFQPVPCMHCEKAPCEVGCPVNATTHSSEGINQQVYNRCIGTRTCEAYCPYEVRRFNFLDYGHTDAPAVEAQRNPDVTVRARGVMEKCTYCIQRIERARIDSARANRHLDGDAVLPACAQACPTAAIRFGDLARPQGRMQAWRRDPRHYAMLPELNTWPRTTYLARIRRPIGEGGV